MGPGGSCDGASLVSKEKGEVASQTHRARVSASRGGVDTDQTHYWLIGDTIVGCAIVHPTA